MTQGELEQIPLVFERLMSALEMRVMSDVVERIRINKDITSTADWQITRMYQLGESKRSIKKWIAEALGMSKKEVKKLYHDGLYNEYIRNKELYKAKGQPWIPFEDNQELQTLIKAIQEQTKGEFKNITQSLGFVIKDKQTGKLIQSPLLDFYQSTLDNAVMDITTGAFDYNTVLNRTISQMTNSGLRTVDYDSGHSNRVEVVARRAVMTGFSQVQGRINQQVAKDLDTDSYEVSWHGGARPSHQTWQGKVYTYVKLEEICGLGTVSGLCGANCYHDYSAFLPGISVRTYTDDWLDEQNKRENTPIEYNGKEYTMYEALQRQRKMECLMRKQRQDINLLQQGKGSEDDILAAKSRYRSSMSQYANFSEKMKLPQQRDRIYMDGLRDKFTPSPKEQKQIEEKRRYAIIESELKTAGIKGKLNLKPDKIDINNFKFDEKHINAERKHNITKEEAQQFIKEAHVVLERWNGRFHNYYSENGSVYVDVQNNIVRTAFKTDEYDENTKKIIEVMKKYGKD